MTMAVVGSNVEETPDNVLQSPIISSNPKGGGGFPVRKFIIGLILISLLGCAVDNYYRVQKNYCNISLEERIKRWGDLEKAMHNEVFGQQIAVQGSLNVLYAHITDPNPTKALTLSFHGWLGGGKTFLSQLIAKHLYLDNPLSVQTFFGPRHFLLDEKKLQHNQKYLSDLIESTIRRCGRSLFVFDEVDKMPAKILDVLVPYLDHHGKIDGLNYRNAVFIFLSNTGGEAINGITTEYIKKGGKRNDMTMYDFRQAVADGAFTEKGGLFNAQMITKHLVDHFIPFLPLEREHIIMCAKREMKRRNVLFVDPGRIADRVTYLGEMYAEDGCKNIASHVGYFLHHSDSLFKDEL